MRLAIWQSIRSTCARRSSSTRRFSATFEASRSVLNIDSPKNTRPSATPYRPPTSRSSSPVFDRMRVAQPCSCDVGGAHFRREPGAAGRAGRRCRSRDDFAKGGIEADRGSRGCGSILADCARPAVRPGTAPRADRATTTGSAGRASTTERCRADRRRAVAAGTGRRPRPAGHPARAARDRPAGMHPANPCGRSHGIMLRLDSAVAGTAGAAAPRRCIASTAARSRSR